MRISNTADCFQGVSGDKGGLRPTLPLPRKSFEGQERGAESSYRVSAIRPLSMGHLEHFIKGKLHPLFTLPATHIPHVSLLIH